MPVRADNYLDSDYTPATSEADQPLGTVADFGKTLGAGALGIGSNLAAASRYFYEAGGSEHGADISQGIQRMFGAGQKSIEESINPETRKLAASSLTSDEFWQHPLLATALKATGMVPAVAALAIPGGLLADAVGGTLMAAAGGAAINAGTGLDEFYKKLDAMSDDELKDQSPKYKALAEMYGEKEARAKFNTEMQGMGPAINAVIGAAAGVVGPAGTAARGLAGGAPVLGAAGRGAIGRGLVGGAEGAVANALQAGVGDITQQQAEINAHMQKEFDLARAGQAALEGGALGGLMGGAVGLVAGGGAHRAPKAEAASQGAALQSLREVTSEAPYAAAQSHGRFC